MSNPIPTTQHLTLKRLINETYTDGIDQIIDSRLEDDGTIIVLARDEDRIVAFKYTDEIVSIKILNPDVIEGEDNTEEKTDDKYSHINFTPPESVQKAFKRALSATDSGKLKIGSGMEAATKAWAKKLANGESVSPEKARQGYRWFKRNARFENEPKDSPAWASWAYWGYSEGRSWFNRLWRQMEAVEKADAEPFTPSSSDGDFQNLSRLLASFDWTTIRNIAEEQGWQWDDDLARYLDIEGKVVTHQQILDVTQAELARLEIEVEEATALLVEGDATVPEWEELIAEITVGAALLFLLFGLGNKQPNEITESMARTHLERQFGFLQNFAKSVLAGGMTANGIAARAKLYLHDAQLLYGLAQEFIHPIDVYPFYSNVLGPCQSCPECPQIAAKGIVPRGTLKPIGQRQCFVNCCCQWSFHKTQDERTDQKFNIVTLKNGWLGGQSFPSQTKAGL